MAGARLARCSVGLDGLGSVEVAVGKGLITQRSRRPSDYAPKRNRNLKRVPRVHHLAGVAERRERAARPGARVRPSRSPSRSRREFPPADRVYELPHGPANCSSNGVPIAWVSCPTKLRRQPDCGGSRHVRSVRSARRRVGSRTRDGARRAHQVTASPGGSTPASGRCSCGGP